MTKMFSLEFFVAVLFILDIFLFFLILLIVKRVNRFKSGGVNKSSGEDPGLKAQEEAFQSAGEVLGMLEPLVKESQEAASAFDDLIREKKKISRDLNDALDSRIISINLLLSRAAGFQKQMEEEQERMRQTVSIPPVQSLPPREPDVLDQQNQIIELYRNKMNVDTIAEQLSIPKGEVQLVVDLKEKFMAMEQKKMILSLGISTPEITLGKDAVKNPAFKALQEGQVVRAKVLGTGLGSKAQLLIGGQKLMADTQVPLTPGQEIVLKFTQEKGIATLKLIQSLPSQGADTGQDAPSSRGAGRETPAITLEGEAVDSPAVKGMKEGQVVRAKVINMLSGTKAQLLVGGQKLTAETGQSLAPGQEMSLKLVQKGQVTFKQVQVPNQPNQNAAPSPASTSSLAGGKEPTLSQAPLSDGGKESAPPTISLSKEAVNTLSLPELKTGQPVRAAVLGMLSTSKAQVLIQDRSLTVQTDQPLPVGKEITLEFMQEKNALTFKPLAFHQDPGMKEGVPLAKMAQGMLSFERLGQEPGTAIDKLLDTIALKSGERDEGFVPRLLSNSGMLMEQKIATLAVGADANALDSGMQKLIGQDLKAALLSLANPAAEGEHGGKSPSAELSRAVVSVLENFQTLNAQPTDSQRFIIPFPVMAGDQFNFGQLFMDTGKKKEGDNQDSENKVMRVAFLLNMTALGDLRADFSILKKSIAGRFLLQDQATCQYMESLIPVLGQRLSAVGFQMGRVDCAVAEPSQLSSGALIQTMAAERQVKGLDLVI